MQCLLVCKTKSHYFETNKSLKNYLLQLYAIIPELTFLQHVQHGY